jgi:dolichol-phosphate mannosyltransferase
MTALSLAAVVYQVVDSLRRPEISHGISILIVLVVFFGSLTLLAISVLGEYLIRVFEEVKRRPRFIRKALWQGGRGLSSAAEMESFVGRRKAALRSTRAGATQAGSTQTGSTEAGGG